MNLYLVELTRLRWRRAVLALAVLAAAVAVLVVTVMAWNTRPLSDDDQARVDAQLEQLKEDNLREHQRMLADCEKRPADFGVGTAEQCADNLYYSEPDETWLGYRAQLDDGMVLDSGTAVAIIAILLALLLGTTYAGADWNTGSLSNQLLFRPRRPQVWLAKTAAATTAGLVMATVTAGLYWGVIALLVATRDLDFGTAAFWKVVAGQAGRGIGLAAGAALLGTGLAMLLRSTVATLGMVIAAGVGSTILFNTLPVDGLRRWTLDGNLLAVLRDGHDVEQYLTVCSMEQEMESGCVEIIHISMTQGVLCFSAVLAVVLVLSVLSFRRRDVP